MKGGQLNKIVPQRTWFFVALLTVFQSSLALKIPPLHELHALTDFAQANAIRQMFTAGLLHDWNISWDGQGRWLGDNPCSRFQGVVCWSTGDLMMIKLSQSGLQGPISPALGKLNTINTLYLGENELSGNIGPILANLTWMKRLKLEGNSFTGSLQSTWLQRMHELEELILARNSFVGDIQPGVFTNLNNLTTIDLSNNFLSGPIPYDLVSLPSLRNLSLSGNNFTGRLPKILSNSTLHTVNISHNLLRGHLPTVWNTPNLASLDLSGNSLSGLLPLQLLSLTSLTHLNLAQNKFVGNVSAIQSAKFGCSAFAGNPGLVLLDQKCALPPPSPFGDSSTPPMRFPKRSKGFSTVTIVALIVADVAFILMSVIACVLFFIWYKKSTDSVKVGTCWPDATKDGDSSKDFSTSSVSSMSARPKETTTLPKSSLAAKPDVKPALKSVVGTVRDPASDIVTADESLDQSFSSLDNSFSITNFGANIVILDTTLSLEFEDLLSAKALILGAGSFGVVYMACMEDGHMLAIKRIEEMVLADRRAFGEQCAQLAEVLHPNLLQLRGYCWSPQEKLLIFDYLKNGSVRSLLHVQGRGSFENPVKDIDWATRLKIAVGTARALAHLHDSDMVHGNIKASNVLLDEQFEPRVSDFGLETLLQMPLQQHTNANDGYIAPELVTGGTRRRTQDGDVYSLGVLLLELLTGKEPKGDLNGGLPGWVQEMTSEKRTMELLDPALVSIQSVFPSAQDILEFLGLAQACVSHDATARPSITIVLRSLESIVPGSTAPRSYVKHDSIDSDASYPDTTKNPFSHGYNVVPLKDDTCDDDDGGSF